MVKNCMFKCPPDDLELGDHWEQKCKGNPDVGTMGRVCKEHVWEPCCCIAMYCTKSICHFCGEERDGGIHPQLEARMNHEWVEEEE